MVLSRNSLKYIVNYYLPSGLFVLGIILWTFLSSLSVSWKCPGWVSLFPRRLFLAGWRSLSPSSLCSSTSSIMSPPTPPMWRDSQPSQVLISQYLSKRKKKNVFNFSLDHNLHPVCVWSFIRCVRKYKRFWQKLLFKMTQKATLVCSSPRTDWPGRITWRGGLRRLGTGTVMSSPSWTASSSSPSPAPSPPSTCSTGLCSCRPPRFSGCNDVNMLCFICAIKCL